MWVRLICIVCSVDVSVIWPSGPTSTLQSSEDRASEQSVKAAAGSGGTVRLRVKRRFSPHVCTLFITRGGVRWPAAELPGSPGPVLLLGWSPESRRSCSVSSWRFYPELSLDAPLDALLLMDETVVGEESSRCSDGAGLQTVCVVSAWCSVSV